MNTLFFIINQDPFDGSAHGLYCLRNCRGLAEAAPEKMVRLVYPGALSTLFAFSGRRDGETGEAGLHRMGLSALSNLRLHPLPALRRVRGRSGVTVNAVFFRAANLFLRRTMVPGDMLASASFPRLMHFLYGRLDRIGPRVYEVHQLAVLERGAEAEETRIEKEVLSQADVLLTTTRELRDRLQNSFPGKVVRNLGLACGFEPGLVPDRIVECDGGPRNTPRSFTLAYIGSLYPEQGVFWLVQVWEEIARRIGVPIRLEIAGGGPREVVRLRELAGERTESVRVHGPVVPENLPALLQGVDALIIPALNRGRMPYVAITKAFDYLGLNRPILAANLPSIAEVLRPEREAVLFAPEDADQLADAVSRISSNADLTRSLTANCRTRQADFTWKNRSTAWWRTLGT